MKKPVCILEYAIEPPGCEHDVAFVPPMTRRRLSPLQRIYFSLAAKVGTVPYESSVFACRDGEDSLTRRLVEDFNCDGSVSPHRFSTSVYNAAPGLWSVFKRNRAAYTAVASGEGTIEAGLLEALSGPLPALFVYAEETGGGYGAAMLLGSDGSAPVVAAPGDPSAPPMCFDALAAFLSGSARSLTGRWLSLCR